MSMTDLSGQSLGRYHILEALGEGGMATVYKAFDSRLDRDVAVKFIRIDLIGAAYQEQMLKRFEREAKSLARLSHPNILKVHDYGDFNGLPYLVMEYLAGGSLKAKTGKVIPYQEAASLLAPIARALDYANGEGIIHRDVKPANILLTKSGMPMLSDFGIAKIFNTEESTQLTGTGVGIGTPEYMAPEQWTGKTSPQSDQYALGVVFYELVTGVKPYTADTPAAILLKQAYEPLPRPRLFIKDLPDEVEHVLFKSLSKQPDERYPSMADLAVALERLTSGRMSNPIEGVHETVTVQDVPRHQPDMGGSLTIDPLAFKINSTPETAPTNTAKQAKEQAATGREIKTPSRGIVMFGIMAGIGIAAASLWLIFGGMLRGSAAVEKPASATDLAATATLGSTAVPTELPKATITSAPSHTPAPSITPTPEATLAIGETKMAIKDGMVMVSMGNYLVDQTAITNDMFDFFVVDTGYVTDVEKSNLGYVHSTELVCPTWTTCKPGVIGQDTRSAVDKWKQSNVNWRSWSSDPKKFVVQISWSDADSYCKWAGRRLLTEQEFKESSSKIKQSNLFEWVNEKKFVDFGVYIYEYPGINALDYSLDALTFRCALAEP